MVHDEGLFEAAHLLETVQHHAGVAHERVDRHVQRADGRARGDDRVEIRQIQHHRRRAALHGMAGGLAGSAGSRRADHMCAAQCQHAHRFLADARGAAGHDDRAAPEVEARGRLFGGRVRIQRRRACEAGQGAGQCGQRAGLEQAAPAGVDQHRRWRPSGSRPSSVGRRRDGITTADTIALRADRAKPRATRHAPRAARIGLQARSARDVRVRVASAVAVLQRIRRRARATHANANAVHRRPVGCIARKAMPRGTQRRS